MGRQCKEERKDWAFTVFYQDSDIVCQYDPNSRLVWIKESKTAKEVLLDTSESLCLMQDLDTFQKWKKGAFESTCNFSSDLSGVIFSCWLSDYKVFMCI